MVGQRRQGAGACWRARERATGPAAWGGRESWAARRRCGPNAARAGGKKRRRLNGPPAGLHEEKEKERGWAEREKREEFSL